MRMNGARIVVTAAAVWFAAAATASAAAFSLNPTQIFLSGRTTSALLTLSNQSGEDLRFQLSVFEWHQTAAGEIELLPTEDVVFFPALLTLKPGEERRIRVGSVVPAGVVEKTYRIFVEELPPPAAAEEGSAVRVLTKMGVPIFVRPGTEEASAALGDLGLRGGALHFKLSNTGTVHFVPRTVTVRGLRASGESVFEDQVTAWYILAGGRRDFEFMVPPEGCGAAASIVVDVDLGSTALEERLQTPAGACAP